MARIFSAARLTVLPNSRASLLFPAARLTVLPISRFTLLHSRAMSFSPPYKWISADELAKILKDPAEKQATAVIDVRDDDFEGGNIVGAKNVPSSQFEDKVQSLVSSSELKDKQRVILHCQLSQQRGPKAARIYAETKAKAANGGANEQEVLVLRDGFGGFGPKFKNDPALVEKFDEEAWQYR